MRHSKISSKYEAKKSKNINVEAENINHYRKITHNSLQQELNQVEVGFARSKLTSTPWSNWWTSADSKRIPNDKRVLPWRNDYNQVKHHRVEHYNTTLENTLVAFATLFILIETSARVEENINEYRPPTLLKFCNKKFG